jgi:hypothetical protein
MELLKLQDRIEFRATIETGFRDFLNALDLATPCVTLDSPFALIGLGSGIFGEPYCIVAHRRGLVANLAMSVFPTTGAAFFSQLCLGMDVLKNLLALMRMFRALSRSEIIARKILVMLNESGFVFAQAFPDFGANRFPSKFFGSCFPVISGRSA